MLRENQALYIELQRILSVYSILSKRLPRRQLSACDRGCRPDSVQVTNEIHKITPATSVVML